MIKISIKTSENNDIDKISNYDNEKKNELNISSSGFHLDLFINHDITSKFLMKIYGILLFQFLFIFSLVLIFQIKVIANFIRSYPAFYWTIFAITLFTILVIFGIFLCCLNILRKVPTNYIILLIITICLGLFCASIASFYELETVLCAITCVIAVSIGSFCVGLFDKGDGLKFWYLFVASFSCLAIQYGIMALIFRSHYLNFLYCSILAILYALYISFDTLVIKETYSVDDYILGAIILTLDIIRFFIIILKLLGGNNNK